MPTAIIADDERLMRDQLRMRLGQVWPELEIVGEAKNGDEAVELVGELQARPDLPRHPHARQDGMEAARQIGDRAGRVRHRLRPVRGGSVRARRRRLRAEAARAGAPAGHGGAPEGDAWHASRKAPCVNDSVTAMLSQLAEKMAAPKPNYLQWIQASIGQDLRMIPVEDILFFRSDEKYTCVQTEKFEALIRKPVRDLAEELDPAAVLANPPRHPGQRQRHRRRHPRHARPPPGDDQGPSGQAGSQPQLPASVQADVRPVFSGAAADSAAPPQSRRSRPASTMVASPLLVDLHARFSQTARRLQRRRACSCSGSSAGLRLAPARPRAEP